MDYSGNDNNYIASVTLCPLQAFLAYADLSTGELKVLSLENSKEKILEKLLSIDVRELILPTSIDAAFVSYVKSNSNICISYSNDTSRTLEIESLFINLSDARQIETTARLYNYLKSMERRNLNYFKPAVNLMEKKNMKIDFAAQSNMELVK